MKRKFLGICMVVLLLFCMTGCGENASDKEKGTVNQGDNVVSESGSVEKLDESTNVVEDIGAQESEVETNIKYVEPAATDLDMCMMRY